ncbi:MAG: transcriptional regulator NrdR [Cyanobacteria bacterium P01_D01_bin.156]
MQCPFCQHASNRVLESRSAEAGRSIRRRRECLKCEGRFTTYERIEYVPVTVIKRSGNRELFNRSKLLRGIARACEKTGLDASSLDAIVDNIEMVLQQRSTREISSADIGELALKELRPLNEVAYVRFASVYRQFTGIRDFADTLNHLQTDVSSSPLPSYGNSVRQPGSPLTV